MGHEKKFLKAVEYKLFYESLWHKIVEVEFRGTAPDNIKEYSEGIFKFERDRRPFIYQLLEGTYTTDGRYLFRRYDQSRRADNIRFDSLVLYNGLVYLGHCLDEDKRLIKDVLDRKERVAFVNSALLKVDRMFNKFMLDVTGHNNSNIVKQPEAYLELEIEKPSTANDKLMEAVNAIYEYYGRGADKYFCERNLFTAFVEKVETRLQRKISSMEEESHIATKNFDENYYELYTLKDERIARMILSIGETGVDDNPDENKFNSTSYGFKCYFDHSSPDGNKLEQGYCYGDLIHQNIVLVFLGLENDGLMFDEYVSLSSNMFKDYFVGHKVAVKSKNGLINISPVLLRKGELKKEQEFQLVFEELEYSDPKIPDFVKSILFSPFKQKEAPNPWFNFPSFLAGHYEIFEQTLDRDRFRF